MTTPQLSYPGVYIQEIPSGSRSITGVATAIAAFAGRALKGPVDEPVAISSFGEFERVFGGLWRSSGLGYAVRDYYLNGGGNAVVVRLGGGAQKAAVRIGEHEFHAAEHGAWAEGLVIRLRGTTAPEVTSLAAAQAHDTLRDATVDLRAAEAAAQDAAGAAAEAAADTTTKKKKDDATAALQKATDASVAQSSAQARVEAATAGVEVAAADDGHAAAIKEIADQQGVAVTDLWQLDVLDGDDRPDDDGHPPARAPQTLESFPNVTFVDGPRRIDRVLQASRFIRMTPSSGTPAGPVTPGPAKADPPAAGPAAADPTPADPATPTPPAADPEPGDVTTDTTQYGTLTGGSDGGELVMADYIGDEAAKTGVYALEKTDLFTLLSLPPSAPAGDLPPDVWATALAYCRRRGAFLLVDPPAAKITSDIGIWPSSVGLNGVSCRNAALYFPRICYPDPLRDGTMGAFVPSGAVAGVMASTDASRGVWKAPAGLEAGIAVGGLALGLTDAEHGQLPNQVNALRLFPNVGPVVWGARTLRGADIFADDYKYVPVRRLALFLEQSLFRGTQWVVFEPNDEPLWSQVRTTLTAFMQDLFRQGAFQGRSPREAYFVQCGADTTTPYDIARGVVNIRVGFAPLRPAEFVVVGIQQMTATAAT